MLLERFLELVAAVVGAQGDAASRRGRGAAGGLAVCSMKLSMRGNALLDLVAAVGVDLVGAADGIADVLLEFVQRLVKFAQQEGLLRRLRDRAALTVSTWLWVMPKM